nr:polysaccharide deacetylase family protein [Sedimentibacter sp.]
MIFIKKNIIPTLVLIFVIIFSYLNFEDISNSYPVSTSPSIRLPIIMYHEINSKNLGKYIVSPQELEEDIVFLKNSGYTTITIEDLIAFEYNDAKLPEKPIMLTFDDGYYSSYSYILPIFEKYNCKAVISIVGEYVDESTKSEYSNGYINWSQVKELVDSPYIEIQNHTYAMHELSERKGCKIIEGESYDKYKMQILDDVGYLQMLIQEKTGYTPKAFTYPFGITCKECDEILEEMGFMATLSCYSGVNLLSGNIEELYELKRFNRPSGINRANFFKQFEK